MRLALMLDEVARLRPDILLPQGAFAGLYPSDHIGELARLVPAG